MIYQGLEFFITDFCNLNCPLCSRSVALETEKKHISVEYMKEVSRYFKPYEFHTIKITGGEPTLHPDFLEICALLPEYFPAHEYEMATNGFRLQQYIDKKELAIFSRISFSRYPGFNDTIYNNLLETHADSNLYFIDREIKPFDDVFVPRKTPYFRYAFCEPAQNILICNDRLYPCPLAVSNALRQNINSEAVSIPVDGNWRESMQRLLTSSFSLCDSCSCPPETAPQDIRIVIGMNEIDTFPGGVSTYPFFLPLSDRHDRTEYRLIVRFAEGFQSDGNILAGVRNFPSRFDLFRFTLTDADHQEDGSYETILRVRPTGEDVYLYFYNIPHVIFSLELTPIEPDPILARAYSLHKRTEDLEMQMKQSGIKNASAMASAEGEILASDAGKGDVLLKQGDDVPGFFKRFRWKNDMPKTDGMFCPTCVSDHVATYFFPVPSAPGRAVTIAVQLEFELSDSYAAPLLVVQDANLHVLGGQPCHPENGRWKGKFVLEPEKTVVRLALVPHDMQPFHMPTEIRVDADYTSREFRHFKQIWQENIELRLGARK